MEKKRRAAKKRQGSVTVPTVTEKTIEELESAANNATEGLMKLLGDLKRSTSNAMDLTLEHLIVQDRASQDLLENTEANVANGDAIISSCGDLLTLLDETEELASKVARLKDTVDNAVDHLKAITLSK